MKFYVVCRYHNTEFNSGGGGGGGGKTLMT